MNPDQTGTFGGTVPNALIAIGLLLVVGTALARLAERIRVPRVTIVLATGIVLGLPALHLVTPEARSLIHWVERGAGCAVAFSIGVLFRLDTARHSVRALSRFVSCTFLAVIPACALVSAWALPSLGLAAGAKATAVLALTLATVSPTMVVAVAQELDADGPVTRVAMAGVVAADFALMVLLITLSAGSAVASADTAGALSLAKALGLAMALGAGAGLSLTRIRSLAAGEVAGAVLLVAIVVAARAAQGAVASLAFSVSAGVCAASNVGDARRDLTKLARELLPVTAPVLFGVEGLLLDARALAMLAIPAGALVVARALAIWLGARAGFDSRETAPQVRRYAFAGFLPQAGFALAVVGLLPTLFPSFGESIRSLAVAVVGINELVMPPVLQLALRRAGEARAARPLPG